MYGFAVQFTAGIVRGAENALLTKTARSLFHGKRLDMIYWPIQADEFTMRIPNPLGYIPAAGDPALWLEIRNNVGLQVYATGLEPDEITPLYFVKTGSGRTIPDAAGEGEYTYTLRLGAGGIVLSEGLLVAGDYTPERKEYDKKIEYKQYGK